MAFGFVQMCSTLVYGEGGTVELAGEYQVWEGQFICKMGYAGDPEFIRHVKAAEWNERAIVLTQRWRGEERYFVVWDDGDWVGCGTSDTLLGPFTADQLESERRALGLPEYLGNRVRIR